MKLIPYEKEVHISFNDEEDYATIYTASRSTITRCKKLGYEIIHECKSGGQVIAITFRCPKNLISFRSGNAKKRVLTEEQKKASSDRMKAMNKKQGLNVGI